MMMALMLMLMLTMMMNMMVYDDDDDDCDDDDDPVRPQGSRTGVCPSIVSRRGPHLVLKRPGPRPPAKGVVRVTSGCPSTTSVAHVARGVVGPMATPPGPCVAMAPSVCAWPGGGEPRAGQGGRPRCHAHRHMRHHTPCRIVIIIVGCRQLKRAGACVYIYIRDAIVAFRSNQIRPSSSSST